MKALTICQPFAQLIVRGHKRVENREWPTRYRGPLLIHAGKSREWMGGEVPASDMIFGAIVGSAQLVDCLHIEQIEAGMHRARFPWLEDHPHTEGTWCWVLDQIVEFEIPTPCKGALGLWQFDQTLLHQAGVATGVSTPVE